VTRLAAYQTLTFGATPPECEITMRICDENVDLTVGPGARKEALDYATTRFREKETTKRILIIAITILSVTCGLGIIFAPEGREEVACIVAPVLYILSLGVIGVSRFVRWPHLSRPQITNC